MADTNLPLLEEHRKTPSNVIKVNLYAAIAGVALIVVGLFLIPLIVVFARHKSSRYECKIFSEIEWRLPETSRPIHYDIHLRPQLSSRTFNARVVLTSLITAETSCIVLNAYDLNFTSVKLAGSKNNKKYPIETTVQKDNQRLIISLDRSYKGFTVGNIVDIEMEYSGIVTDNFGLYRFKYEAEGKTKHALVTQNQANYARNILPCYDEPKYKATMASKITLKSEDADLPDMKVLANAPLNNTISNNGSTTYVFEDISVSIPIYLLAFAIGEFGYIENSNASVPFRFFTYKGQEQNAVLDLEIAVDSYNLMSRYFAINPPFVKQDLIAVEYNPVEAMENPGLITMQRDMYLIYKHTTEVDKRAALEIVVHEIVHQWIGNLVTPVEWNHLWLNEGFASLYSVINTNILHPEWNRWLTRLQRFSSPFLQDSTLDELTHPLINEAYTRLDVDAIFDGITYNKAAAFLRMLYTYFGEENFKQFMRSYLNKYMYEAVDSTMFFNTLDESMNTSLTSKLMHWASTPGYPVVIVKEQEKGGYSLSQTRFFRYMKLNTNAKPAQPWWIPVAIRTKSDPLRHIIFDSTTRANAFSIASGDWVKLNVEQQGFYRVVYPDDLLDRLFDALPSMNDLDRFNAVEELVYVTIAGYTRPSVTLRQLLKMKNETSYLIFNHIVSGLSSFYSIFSNNQTVLDKIDVWAQKVIESQYQRLGWHTVAEESVDDLNLRPIILAAAVKHNLVAAIDAGAEIFDLIANGTSPTDIESSSIPYIYASVVKSRGITGFNTIFSRFNSSTSTSDKIACLKGLAHASDASHITQILSLNLTTEELIKTLEEILKNSRSTQVAWSIFKKLMFHSDYESLVDSWASNFSTQEQLTELKAYYGKKLSSLAPVIVESNILFTNKYTNDI